MAKGKLQNTLSPVTVDVAYPPLIHNRESKRFSFTVPEAANNQGRPCFPSPVCGVQSPDLQTVTIPSFYGHNQPGSCAAPVPKHSRRNPWDAKAIVRHESSYLRVKEKATTASDRSCRPGYVKEEGVEDGGPSWYSARCDFKQQRQRFTKSLGRRAERDKGPRLKEDQARLEKKKCSNGKTSIRRPKRASWVCSPLRTVDV